MRFLALLAGLLLPAWALADPIGYEGARHLLGRVGFGATDAEIRDFAALERPQAVDRLLAGARREAALKPPGLRGRAVQSPMRASRSSTPRSASATSRDGSRKSPSFATGGCAR
jgi:hypothetical protein